MNRLSSKCLFLIFMALVLNSTYSLADLPTFTGVSNTTFAAHTNESVYGTYIRSSTVVVNGVATDTILSYTPGNDGRIYVQEVVDGVYKGAFSYPDSTPYTDYSNPIDGVPAIPEPEQWLMLLSGLPMVLVAVRRMRSKNV